MYQVVHEIAEPRKTGSNSKVKLLVKDGFPTCHRHSCSEQGIPAAGSYNSTDAHSGFVALVLPVV
jgi:hypothetical protein